MTSHRESTKETGGGSWDYPTLVKTMGETGFEGIIKSVTRRQNTVAQYIVTRTILDLCERSTRRPEVRVYQQWWEQAGINLEGAKKRAAEAATVLESDLELDSNADKGREEELRGVSGSSGAEWSEAEE